MFEYIVSGLNFHTNHNYISRYLLDEIVKSDSGYNRRMTLSIFLAKVAADRNRSASALAIALLISSDTSCGISARNSVTGTGA